MTALQPAEPFKHLKISSAEVLEQLTERSPCPKCHKSRMYFCYNCLVPVDSLTGRIPHVRVSKAVRLFGVLSMVQMSSVFDSET